MTLVNRTSSPHNQPLAPRWFMSSTTAMAASTNPTSPSKKRTDDKGPTHAASDAALTAKGPYQKTTRTPNAATGCRRTHPVAAGILSDRNRRLSTASNDSQQPHGYTSPKTWRLLHLPSTCRQPIQCAVGMMPDIRALVYRQTPISAVDRLVRAE